MSYGITSVECCLQFKGPCPINSISWTKGPSLYCVFSTKSENSGCPIYIGKAECLRTRLDDHKDDKEKIEKWGPSSKDLYICYTILDNEEDLFYVEPALVFRFQPEFNRHYKDRFPDTRPETHVEMSGPTRILTGSFAVYPGQTRDSLRPYEWGGHINS